MTRTPCALAGPLQAATVQLVLLFPQGPLLNLDWTIASFRLTSLICSTLQARFDVMWFGPRTQHVLLQCMLHTSQKACMEESCPSSAPIPSCAGRYGRHQLHARSLARSRRDICDLTSDRIRMETLNAAWPNRRGSHQWNNAPLFPNLSARAALLSLGPLGVLTTINYHQQYLHSLSKADTPAVNSAKVSYRIIRNQLLQRDPAPRAHSM